MQTTPEYGSLLEELYERASIVVDLDGPQLEAWVSGLFPVFDTDISIGDFVTYCADARTGRGAVLIAAIAELSDGLDVATSDLARGSLDPELLPDWSATIGTSELTGAWTVTAPFGRSIVLGFNAVDIIERNKETLVRFVARGAGGRQLTQAVGPSRGRDRGRPLSDALLPHGCRIMRFVGCEKGFDHHRAHRRCIFNCRVADLHGSSRSEMVTTGTMTDYFHYTRA